MPKGKKGFQKGHHINRGATFSVEHRRKLAEAKKGRKLSEITRARMSASQRRYYALPVLGMKRRARMSEVSEGQNNPFYGKHHTEATRQKMSNADKELWKNADHAKKMFEAQQHKPNQEELFLDALIQLNFPDEFKYVGDGKVWIEGKNPDWININGKKIVIEYNGFVWGVDIPNVGHSLKKDTLKAEHYAKYGFKTINLSRDDLNERTVVTRIKLFLR